MILFKCIGVVVIVGAGDMWIKDFGSVESAICVVPPSEGDTGRGKTSQSYPQLSVDNFGEIIRPNEHLIESAIRPLRCRGGYKTPPHLWGVADFDSPNRCASFPQLPQVIHSFSRFIHSLVRKRLKSEEIRCFCSGRYGGRSGAVFFGPGIQSFIDGVEIGIQGCQAVVKLILPKL
jgi:hypothetical protein